MAVSPDGRLLAFTGNRGLIMLVNAVSKQWVADLSANASVRSFEFSADGRRLFTLSGRPAAGPIHGAGVPRTRR